MPAPLLTESQHKRAHRLYFQEDRSAGEVAAIISAEFADEGLKVTPRQIVEYSSTRGWAAKRKALKEKGEARAGEIVTSIASSIAERKTALVVKHQDFLDTAAQTGLEILDKARKMIGKTESPRDLASASNAAARGIEIFRKSIGLPDEPGAGGNTGHTFNFNFARGPDSPFTKRAAEQKTTDTPTPDPDSSPVPQSENTHGPHLPAESTPVG